VRWHPTDPGRGAADVLRCITDAPQGVAALAAATGLHPNTVRKHLATLVRVGLVVSGTDRVGRPGRPGRVYAPAPVHPAVRAVSASLADDGFAPDVRGNDVVLATCPFADAVAVDPQVCSLHVRLADSVARPLGASVARVDTAGPGCRLRVTTTAQGTVRTGRYRTAAVEDEWATGPGCC
jgi:predicted ArsR family transcriptional regulator